MLAKLLLVGVMAAVGLVSLTLIGSSQAAFDIRGSSCDASFEVNFNGANHPPLYLDLENLDVNIVPELDGTKRFEVSGDEPFIRVVGVFTQTEPLAGTVSAGGNGNYSGFDTTVTFEGEMRLNRPSMFGSVESLSQLTGKFSVGPDGTLPGGQSIDYALQCDFEPEPIPTPTQGPPGGKVSLITSTVGGDAIPGFEMNLYSGTGCMPGNLIVSGMTDQDGVFSTNQPDGTYSASRKGRAGWNGGEGACFENFEHLAPGTNLNFKVEQDKSPPISPTATPLPELCLNDDFLEENDTPETATAVALPYEQEGLISCIDDVDYFSFQVQEGHAVFIGTLLEGALLDAVVLGPDGAQVEFVRLDLLFNFFWFLPDVGGKHTLGIIRAPGLVALRDDPRPYDLAILEVAVGDVNNDGSIDARDATLVLQFDAGLLGELAANAVLWDVNRDGNVNSLDAILILQFSATLIDEFPRT